jgi:NitT/TauT family transport system substrate-binding protein
MLDTRARWAGCAAVVLLLVLASTAAMALDTIRLGKAVAGSFAFGAADVGNDAKIWEQEGIALDIAAFNGDAQLQQAMTAGSLDIALGSGPALGFRAKGVPAIGVAAMFGPPANLVLVVPMNSALRTVADLRGKRIGVTTAGSLTDWLARELSRQQGWGSDGIKVMALGSAEARLALMQTGEIDGSVNEAATGYELEELGRARILLSFGGIAKDFYTHVIFATDDMVAKRPELLRRFLRGWFRTIAFMKANKDFTVASEAKTIGVRASVAAKVYDAQISSFSTDGAWNPAAIDVIRRSLRELGILDFVPEAKTIYNDQFVPVKF